MFSLISRRTVLHSGVVSPRPFTTTIIRRDPSAQHRAGKPPGLDHLENPSASEEAVHAEKSGQDPLGKDPSGGSATAAWDKVKQVAEDVKEKVVGSDKK